MPTDNKDLLNFIQKRPKGSRLNDSLKALCKEHLAEELDAFCYDTK
jgi:hypothetical protein